MGLELRRLVQGRHQRGETPGDLGFPAVVVGDGVEQGVVGVHHHLRRGLGGLDRHDPAVPRRGMRHASAGDVVIAALGPDRHAEVGVTALAEDHRRLDHGAALLQLDGHLAAAAVGGRGADPDPFERPVGVLVLDQPAVEERRPVGARVEGGQLALQVGVVERLEGVVVVDLLEEGEEPVGAEPVLDHADDLSPAVVGQAEECAQVAHLPERPECRAPIAARPPAVVARQPEVLAADRRQPAQALRPDDQRGVPTVLGVEPEGGDAVDDSLVHERLGVAVGPDDVPEPLVAGLVRDQVVEVARPRRRQPHHPVVEQHQPRALVAVPAEERGRDLELVVVVGAEPALVEWQDLGGEAQDPLGVGPVLGERDHPDQRRADAALEDLEPVGADQREVARRARLDHHELSARPRGSTPGDPPRRGHHLALGQVEPHHVMPRLLIPGLMPGDERGPLPAALVVMRQDRIPVQQIRDPAMVPPPPPVIGQLKREVDLDDDRLPRRHRVTERDDHHGVDGGVEREAGRPVPDPDLGDDHPVPLRVHRLLGAEPEHLQRLRQGHPVLVLHPVTWIDVEDELGGRDARPVREPDPLARRDPPLIQVEPGVDVIPRQPGRDRRPRPLIRGVDRPLIRGMDRPPSGPGGPLTQQAKPHDQPDDPSPPTYRNDGYSPRIRPPRRIRRHPSRSRGKGHPDSPLRRLLGAWPGDR